MGQESRCGLVGCLWVGSLKRLQSRVSWGRSYLKGNLGSICFQAHSQSCCQISEPCWLLVRHLSSLLHGPLHRVVHNIATCFPQRRENEKWQVRQKSQIFKNLILEVTSHHNCQILFTRRESLGSVHMKGEEIKQGVNIRRQGSLGAIFEAACHTGYISQKLSTDQYKVNKTGMKLLIAVLYAR